MKPGAPDMVIPFDMGPSFSPSCVSVIVEENSAPNKMKSG